MFIRQREGVQALSRYRAVPRYDDALDDQHADPIFTHVELNAFHKTRAS